MFAGIIEAQGRIRSVEQGGGMLRVRVAKPRSWKLSTGQSVAVDGVCSTVIRHSTTWFDVEYMPETIKKTSVGDFKEGRSVNIERSLKYGQRIDGHPVQGHVDACVSVRAVEADGRSRLITIKPAAALSRGAQLHGSIAINGASLTVAKKHGPNITVALIPHTLRSTNLGDLMPGDSVNVEFDHTAAYMAAQRKR